MEISTLEKTLWSIFVLSYDRKWDLSEALKFKFFKHSLCKNAIETKSAILKELLSHVVDQGLIVWGCHEKLLM